MHNFHQLEFYFGLVTGISLGLVCCMAYARRIINRYVKLIQEQEKREKEIDSKSGI